MYCHFFLSSGLVYAYSYGLNKGLLKWEQARAQWLSNKSENDTDSTTARAAVAIDVDEVIDVIFSPLWKHPEGNGPPRRFPQNVPLPQMVDILVDLWEAEGLDT